MLRNYLLSAWRALRMSRGYAAINIAGLSVGMAGAMLIFVWLQHEVGVDRFHKKGARLYQVYGLHKLNGEIRTNTNTPEPMAPALKLEFPEIEASSRYSSLSMVFRVGNSLFPESAAFVDKDFFSMFSFPFVIGNARTAFRQPNSVVLTQAVAEKLFGSAERAMGETLVINNEQRSAAIVTGILRDLPANTRFTADAVFGWKMYEMMGYKDESPHAWTNSMTTTFVLLKPGVDLAAVNHKIKDITHRKDPMAQSKMFLYPSSKWYLYNKFENGKVAGGRIDRIYMFSAIAVFILLIACINFMNLSTARSEKRAREVGVRKVAGASRSVLTGQFIFESILLAFLSGIIALLLVSAVIKPFEDVLGQRLRIPYNDPWLWIAFIGFILFTGVLAGSYPAFFLSSFRPVKVLKGSYIPSLGKFNPRKALVVLQFTFAIGLIACTLVVRQQVKYAQRRDLGYRKDQLVSIPLNNLTPPKAELIRREILAAGIATSVTKTMFPMTYSYNSSSGIDWEGKQPNAQISFNRYAVDADWVKTTGVQLVAGRDIDIYKFPTDSTAMLLNESAVRAMGFEDPVGKKVEDNGISWTVVGAVKNFVFNSPYDKVVPMIIEGPKSYFTMMTMRLNSKRKMSGNIAALESLFKRDDPEDLFTYTFADEGYAVKFEGEKRTAVLTAIFSTLAIFISCLGLFGLAAYMTERRSKEIGVRKVLGASVGSILKLISSEFIKLVGISFLIATPLSYYIMTRWLEGFNYRKDIGWAVFAVTGILALAVAACTVSFQAIRAATANPVKSLRTE
ncbi:ABC transporter permease [Compostibacter hankyongensis]|uniref:ABC transporter permease n=1 Tax=Compostibacter hankyongensis TaxID=1007089 RepID=A0ABP8FCA5_9BACT